MNNSDLLDNYFKKLASKINVFDNENEYLSFDSIYNDAKDTVQSVRNIIDKEISSRNPNLTVKQLNTLGVITNRLRRAFEPFDAYATDQSLTNKHLKKIASKSDAYLCDGCMYLFETGDFQIDEDEDDYLSPEDLEEKYENIRLMSDILRDLKRDYEANSHKEFGEHSCECCGTNSPGVRWGFSSVERERDYGSYEY